jgi:hypothetical protein
MLRLLLSTFLIVVCIGSAQAQSPEPRFVVPDVPGGAVVSGCYRADRLLYGPYSLSFCLRDLGRGSYSVQGPELVCGGRLTWQATGETVTLALRRQSCNRGRAWAAAEVTCRPRSLLSAILDELIRELAAREGQRPRVVVPDTPTVGRLSCTYYPTVNSAMPRQFFANRNLVQPR